jgi:hypothetical protein
MGDKQWPVFCISKEDRLLFVGDAVFSAIIPTAADGASVV